MRKTRGFLLGEDHGTRWVHVISRTAGKEILFGDGEKESFRKILCKQLKFSGLRALAWCFMGNHFHLLLEVPDKNKALEGWTEEDFIERLSVLKDELSTRLLLEQVEIHRRNHQPEKVAAIAERVRARLFDLSMFMKELKLKMTAAYNYAHGREGTLWEGRFKSLLVERGEALRTVAAYIDLNPIRAGLVEKPEDYRWCSYAAAVAGVRSARAGLVRAVSSEQKISWAEAAAEYRLLLFGKGEAVAEENSPEGEVGAKAGFSTEQMREIRESGGKMSLAAVLRCRVRYFTDGVVLGGQEFVDGFFEDRREDFGSRRKNGGRRMRGAEWGDLRVLRDLKVEPILVPDEPTIDLRKGNGSPDGH